MRITNSMMMKNYTRSLSDNLGQLDDSYGKVSSEKKFTRVSEDPVGAIKTLRTLHNMSATSQYSDNISQASSDMANTESTLNTVTSILQKAQEDILAANNGTSSAGDYVTYSTEITSLRDELLDTLNSTYNGNYVFGGSVDGPAPFQLASDGSLQIYDYNAASGSRQYVNFDAITTDAKSGYELSNKIDVGLGLSVDSSGAIVEDTAFEAATSAIDLLSLTMKSSTDTPSTGTNVFDALANSVAKLDTAASSSASVNLATELDEVYDAEDNASNATTVVGQKSSMLSFLSDKTETQTTNQTTRLSSLEDIDLEDAIMDYETRQVVYNASLAVGPKILQRSLIDFLS